MSEPKAVVINDVHYNLATLDIADRCMRMAINKANTLKVPLIVAGDLHDTKATLRAECISRMIETFFLIETPTRILRGNHCSHSEKSKETALKFLDGINGLELISDNTQLDGMFYIPYENDPETLYKHLLTIPYGSTLIMHQGLKDSNSGEYGDRDKSAITHAAVKNFRVISGHYHCRQDIKTGRPQKGAVGLWTYTGNPYTLNFGEARDPEKGFHVLYDNGLLEFIPTNQRKHIIFELEAKDVRPGHVLVYNQDDLLWLKITGTKAELSKLDRQVIIAKLNLNAAQIRIDLIPSATIENGGNVADKQDDSLDNVIHEANIPEDQKERLKKMWREKL